MDFFIYPTPTLILIVLLDAMAIWLSVGVVCEKSLKTPILINGGLNGKKSINTKNRSKKI